MGLSQYVTTDDIVARWRALDSAESALAETLLEDAGLILEGQRPTLAPAVASGLVNAGLVRIALARAVRRVLANPDSVKAQTIGADGSVGVTFTTSSTGTQSLDGIYFLDSDLADIDRALANAKIGAGSNRAWSQPMVAYPRPAPNLLILPTP